MEVKKLLVLATISFVLVVFLALSSPSELSTRKRRRAEVAFDFGSPVRLKHRNFTAEKAWKIIQTLPTNARVWLKKISATDNQEFTYFYFDSSASDASKKYYHIYFSKSKKDFALRWDPKADRVEILRYSDKNKQEFKFSVTPDPPSKGIIIRTAEEKPRCVSVVNLKTAEPMITLADCTLLTFEHKFYTADS